MIAALEPGQRKNVTFTITSDMLSLVNQDGKSILEPGQFKITLGGSCPQDPCLGCPQDRGSDVGRQVNRLKAEGNSLQPKN